ncbi:MAG: hypothetical protein IT428_10415 [Planctomycetaceae bacterium]|nr:hypothetical protein [Planctomycetaceae bacterium]
MLWLLLLVTVICSPIIVLFQWIFLERRWRIAVLLAFAPVVLVVVLVVVMATGMAGFQFGK